MISLKNLFRRGDRTDVFGLGEKRLAQLKAEGRYSTYRNTRAALRKLSLFRQGKALPVKDATPALMAAFRDYLLEKMGNSRNTVCENLKIIGRLLTEAGVGKNPCAGLGVSREHNERTYLLEEELARIMALRLKPGSDLDIARDIFFVECRTGLRISDLLLLRRGDISDGFIRLRMQKTKRRIEVPVTESVTGVFRKYDTLFSGPDSPVFPLLDDLSQHAGEFSLERRLVALTSRINYQIKILARRAGIQKNVSTHVGRHTFATMLINRGASIYEVKELLGHSDIKVTQVYAHLLNQRKTELVRLLE